ncbi:MAG: hypothetical protein RBU37_26140 [Myxococcota bacterium]|jgi:hypothetical protein|nr:hypothetical protein [Myxococcota bacterium]
MPKPNAVRWLFVMFALGCSAEPEVVDEVFDGDALTDQNADAELLDEMYDWEEHGQELVSDTQEQVAETFDESDEHEALPDKETVWNEGLSPGVNWGLALGYVNDQGIAAHPAVYAAEDFEAGEVRLPTEEQRLRENLSVVEDPVYTGSYAASFSWPEGLNGPTTRFLLPTEPDDNPHGCYFVRMCYNFDASFHPIDQDRGVGVKGFGIYAEGAGTTDENWYNAAVQFVGWGNSQKPEANDGYLWVGHLYSYNPHPADAVATVGTLENVSDYRFSAYASPFDYIRFNTWRCYEVGLYLNTPGEYDGEARFWIDGVLQSRITHMRFREAGGPLPDNVNINLHRTTEDFPHTMTRWMDNIVISRRYIGPVQR